MTLGSSFEQLSGCWCHFTERKLREGAGDVTGIRSPVLAILCLRL